MKRTPLHSRHIALGAQMTDFGGFDMPVRYSGDKAEHMAVREHVGIFDVSHMGEVTIEGPKAQEAVDTLLTNDASRAANGQAFYAAMLNENGTIIDDLVAYKFSPEKFLICVNASNRDKDVAWITQAVRARFSVSEAKVTDESDDWAQIAVQGPKAVDLVAKLYGDAIRDIKRYHFKQDDMILARTGYTGEDGFEIFCKPSVVADLWNSLLDTGAPFGILPCGLAARDTLRLEAGMCLYGNDIDDTTTPLEAGLSWIVKFDKTTPFIGQNALLGQKTEGVKKRLCGIELTDKGIARHGYSVLSKDGQTIGVVTSGTLTPFLNKAIAMAYVDKPYCEPGTTLNIDVRGRPLAAQVVKLPFYRL
jgi:aminomethyltransferase